MTYLPMKPGHRIELDLPLSGPGWECHIGWGGAGGHSLHAERILQIHPLVDQEKLSYNVNPNGPFRRFY